ncbi:polynucleotide adenylyltransferase [Halarcobacter mediterraneus]|uniref:Polynucleotide adenylyltransferase n=1 Tax=Halarcobacter mediterraneus TaxID=2023153 RepID=A0A4Q1ATR1_9BACT|nr:HD domain-containing protein [Halarcobacter mediterraneus]RXK13163.1 polynucleotide adenylyltransferase [Halarcobacter mediterraneus]
MFISTTKKINIPNILEKILISLNKAKIKPILVGGCVRDSLLNIPNKDFDIELFNCNNLDTVQKILEKFGSVKQVGKSFGVLILDTGTYHFDFALARVEKKTGNGHKDFEVTVDSNLTFEEASLRRDFTINSIGYDYFEDNYLDPNEGLKDLENRTLRHIKDETFIEDPLRVYRAVQFISRFNLTIDKKTFSLCKQLVEDDELKYLPKERVYEEFKKLFLKSKKPSMGFNLLKDLGVLEYFPELKVLVGCIQDKEYHPEGDVWVHTLMTLDEMAKYKTGNEYRDLYLFYALLCHDLGKPFCTEVTNEGRVTSHKHEALGVEPTINFLSRLTDEKKFIEKVVPLVKNHLTPFQLYKAESSLKAVKRLSLKCSIEDLCIVCLADCKGRTIPDKDKCDKAISWVLEKARELNISDEGLKPLVQGRDLISLGMKPSKEFKDILDYALNLQIDESLEKEEILKRIKLKFL